MIEKEFLAVVLALEKLRPYLFVGCLKITEDKSSKSRIETPDAVLIIAITAASRREDRNPRLSITAASRREGRNSRLSITAAPRREGQNPRLSIIAAPKREGRKPRLSIIAAPRREGWNPRLSYNCPCYWVNCPHNEKVNPHYGAFLGGTFTPETSINSPVAMEGRGDFQIREVGQLEIREIKKKSLTWELPQRRKESPTLQVTCCVQVHLCLQSLWDFWLTELCYSVHQPKRRSLRVPDVHPVNGKQDSVSTATWRTQH